MPVFEKNVLRFYVAVNDAVRVGVSKRVRNLGSDRSRFGHLEHPLAIEPLSERLASHERHYIKRCSIDDAGIEQRQYLRMRQTRCDRYLANKPIDCDFRCKLRAEDLDCDSSIVADVERGIDTRHPPFTNLALYPVSVGKNAIYQFPNVTPRRMAIGDWY